MTDATHDSDCAVHNAPALPPGPCDCGAGDLDQFTIDTLMRDCMGASIDDERLVHLHTVKALILAEREACAKIVDDLHVRYLPVDESGDTTDAAIADVLSTASSSIRSRSK